MVVKNHFHSKSIGELLKEFDSDKSGLSKKEAEKRLKQFGANELPEKKKINPIFIFLKQFRSFLIYILIIAGVISFFVNHMVDVYVILGVILINASIGFSQEFRAEKSIQALKKMIVAYAKVYRDGELIQLPAKDLVEGDIIFLEEGDKIPADARIIELKNLRAVESSLTGESFPVDKTDKNLPSSVGLPDKINMVFMGTFIASGNCKALVVATASKTEIGKIAKDIETIKRVQSHFKKKSDILAKQMALIAFIGAVIIFSVGYFIRDFKFTEIFLFTLASLVSAVPEGLPAVLVIVLAIGAYRMSKRNAIVRNLPATETLGIVTTIITDKTGTLTQNTMNVEKIILPGQNEIKVSGKGWEPKGDFFQNNKKINVNDNLQLLKLLKICSLSNNAHIIGGKSDKEQFKILGDPTEAALVVLSEKAGLKKSTLEETEKRIDDIPFNPELKYRASLSVLISNKNKKQIYVVGAPEKILEHSFHFLKNNNKAILTDAEKNNFVNQIESLTKSSMRVLGVAYKEIDSDVNELSEKMVDKLNFVGFVAIKDPVREEVKQSIEKAKNAGIRVVMVTGDHKGTALAIAEEIGLKTYGAYTGQELSKLNKREFSKAVKNTNVFARLTPTMKLKIASELQNQGEIIAMTGDGVNDAPALKKADIGVSMGIIGTDVARESSEIVLADDNFASIINAVEEGRIVFTNTRQASGFLVTTNFAELTTILATLFLGLPLPLLPTQILWLNLVTDGASGVSLASEPGHNDTLHEKPRNPKENVLSKQLIPFLILISGIMVLATLFIFNSYLKDGLDKARTGAFMVMSFTQLFNALNMRSLKKSLFKIGVLSNKVLSIALIASVISIFIAIYTGFFQNVFGFVSLSLKEVATIILISSSVFVLGECYKWFRWRRD